MAYDRDLNFIYRNPTRLIYGENSINEVGLEADALKCSRAFLVTDKGIVNAGLTERVEKALGRKLAGTFDGCIQDSDLRIINDAAEIARGKGADILVSVGGGSVIDTTKGIAIVLKEGGKIEDYKGQQCLTRPQTPHIVIPTTAGTGSEVTYFAVIKDQVNHQKHPYCDDNIIPNVGILDPTMTAGLPPMLTATTGMDAFSHALEAIHATPCSPVADGMALHAIRLIMEYLPLCVENGKDLFARGQQLMASTIAGIAFTNAQVGLVHAIAHTLGGLFQVPHGLANSLMLPHVVRYNMDTCADKYVMIAQAMNIYAKGMSDEEASEAVAEAITALTTRMGVPQRLRDVGVPEDGLVQLAEGTLSDGAIVYNPKPVFEAEEVLGIIKQAW
ncbi:MAG TPA: iron-containing alcohol dehydrogenase [Smithella sp.]|jgi:alcohol dehydrogenase class IV|nr:MAG: 1,3-propanediol dehydrogenase [Deltaproteobacteria bacterium ADurb.Bin022]HOE33239.1 iron-containing alcohol dehydrogenase [Smithella sp.]HOG10607.1 iron-containing alcohol dehydrogenase [Smithella sp.]HQL98079.1 iron-containing alcohol dehydrogenase [Smithella sp.]